MGSDQPERKLPRFLWREMEWPTAEAFIVWTRGVFIQDLIPVVDHLFDSAKRGSQCFEADHDHLLVENRRWAERYAELSRENRLLREDIRRAENARARADQAQTPD